MNRTQKLLAFIAIDIACFLTVLDSTIVNVSLPSMAEHFRTTTTGISWVSTAYLIAFSALLINFSKIADIFGRKRLFLIGLLVFGISSAFCGMADSLTVLIFCRILQGVGAAILTPLPIPLGVELFGKDALGKLSLIVGLTISLSAALGPVLGGILNEFYSYRAIFYVNLPFVLFSLILGWFFVQECYDESISKKVDFIGCALITLAMGCLTFLLVKGNEYGWMSSKIMILGMIVVLSIVGFFLYEGRIKEPMIDFGLFRIRSFTSSIILIAVFFYAYMPVSYLINFYFEKTLGYSVLHAGLMMGIPSLTALVSTPFVPLITKKLSVRVISFVSVAIAVIGNLLLSFMNSSNHMWIICIAFVLMGFGVRITTSLYQTAYEEVDKDKNGIASGIQNSLRQLTACIAIALVSTLSAHYTTTAADYTKNYMLSHVQSSTVLTTEVKAGVKKAAENAAGSTNVQQTKEKVHTLLTAQLAKVSAGVPKEKMTAMKTAFAAQEKELDRILDQTSVIGTDQTYKVYDNCFRITGVIALLGMIAVPFNHRKKGMELVYEAGADAS